MVLKQIFHLCLIIGLGAVLFFTCSNQEADAVKGQTVQWEFSKFSKLTYSFKQIINNNNSFSEFGGEQIMIDGLLLVALNDSGKADIILKGLSSFEFTISESGDTIIDEYGSVLHDRFIQNMNELGMLPAYANESEKREAQAFFGLPGTPFSVGDKFEIPMQMSFNMYGSYIHVKGSMVRKLVDRHGSKLIFNSNIDISDYSLPKSVDEKYELYCKSDGKSHFDQSLGYFTFIDQNMIIKAHELEEELLIIDSVANSDLNEAENGLERLGDIIEALEEEKLRLESKTYTTLKLLKVE